MCSIIGAVIQKPTADDFEMLKRVFLEAKIRGLHATGISFLPRWTKDIVTIKEAIPADQFIQKHMHKDNLRDFINDDGNLYLIGHCRYSTSDLEYNQPISNKNTSVVHNGVITQELPEHWKELYGYDCETKNDTELLLHTIEENVSPLERWKDASLSVCVLSRNKTLKVFRNGKRPQYLTTFDNGVIVTSTKDIIERANVQGHTIEVNMDTYFTFDSDLAMMVERVITGNLDLQHVQEN
jgi:asparagine synthetase B (glutamine-hydrolysing)